MLDFRRWFLVLALALLGAVPPQPTAHSDDCGHCAGARTLECGRCDGAGQRLLPCDRCSGSQRIACLFCYDGTAPCPACGGAKAISWSSGAEDPCKVCKRKGTVKCTFCLGRDSIKCNLCAGKGKAEKACVSCLGMGFLPCPDDRDRPCVLCRDRGLLECARCDGAGELDTWCSKCGLTGSAYCEECDLFGIDVCDQCYGAGGTRTIFEGSSKSNFDACKTCKRKGYKKCKRCDDGVIACEERPTKDCPACEKGTLECKR